ncbi:hypothetical protein DVR12_12705 [Chitinophaga silvatica]|uniref:Uncharacterized protein n=1 Tax=Chitinophaga silvatica TaxID=2282649 RepID=A0A3E1YAB8_9BACT|nr:hypothetical protein DVR12_12705 [Chitinophaga silvatica]
MLKTISGKTYDELSRDSSFHFHNVDLKDTTISESEFIKCIVSDYSKVSVDNIPVIYQFKAFDKARIFGFIYKSVFYFVFFDRNHKGYQRK